ncbi:hypothetical protein KI387_034148, partial [Taxus chinensis]
MYDVFINHRGPDVKEILAKDLYKSLHELQLAVFLDSEELELGDVFPSNIETAIRSSSVHIAIFSKGYADSAWCLAELALMLETDAKIIPVFYGIAPSDLRFIEKGAYAQAFANYEDKGRYLENLERWKKSLQSVSDITGYECNTQNNDHEELCKSVVRAVQKEVQNTKPLHVAEHPVRLNKLVRELESYCKQKEREGENINIIGIFGMGGVGKTTLALELFNNKRSQYSGSCFLYDVREAYARNELQSLQSKLLQDLGIEGHVEFQSINAGISHLNHRLHSAGFERFLIILDDIDNMEQLDALLVRDTSNLIIVTTRDEGLLINAGINLRYNLKGMNRDDGRELFCQHAFSQPHPISGYEDLVDAFVKECIGLPLSLKVFGRHVFGRLQDYWQLELDKIKRVLPGDVLQSLKISFESLDDEEKQIFMDIACFFNDKYKSDAIEIWKISGWGGEHGLQRLKEKCLVEEKYLSLNIVLRMHDHLRDLGRQMAEELTPRRVWCCKYLQSLESKGFQKTLLETNARCFHSMQDRFMDAQITFFIGNSDDCSQESTSLLWLKLILNGNEHTCIPSWIPLQNLQCLKIFHGPLKGLWMNNVQEKIRVDICKKRNFIQFEMCKNLTKLVICQCLELEKLCLESMYFLETIRVDECRKLNCLVLNNCKSMADLAISGCLELKKLCFEGVNNLEKIRVDRCRKLNCLELNSCKKLTKLMICHCPGLEKLCLEGLHHLEMITVDKCEKLNSIQLKNCKKMTKLLICHCPELGKLCLESLYCLERTVVDECQKLICFELNSCIKLTDLTIGKCTELEMLCLEGLNNLQRITVDGCEKLKCLELNSSDKLKYLVLEKLPCLQRVELTTIDGCHGKLKYLILANCGNLVTMSCSFDVSELLIEDCAKLEELPNLSEVERIDIKRCKKLKNIAGIEELQSLKIVHLSQVGSNFIHGLQALSKLPSE